LIVLIIASTHQLAGASNAFAGQVVVAPVFDAGATWGANGWSNGLGGFSMQLNGVNSAGKPIGPAGTFMWIRTQTVPADVSIAAVYHTSRNQSYETSTFGIKMCMPGVFDMNTGGCAVANSANRMLFPMEQTTRSGGVACAVGRCDAVELYVASAQSSGSLTFHADSVVLNDNTAPLVGEASFPALRWHRGTTTGTLRVDESRGVGVKNSELVVDGADVMTRENACNFNLWRPCPVEDTWRPALDTTRFADGPHTAYFRSTDAAGAAGMSSRIDLKVDNTTPDKPTNTTITSDGPAGNWSPTNAFTIDWTNGAEDAETTTQSGLGTITLDIDPTDAGQPDPAPIDIPTNSTTAGITATTSQLTGVTVPAEGAWTLSLRLKDRAGNSSPLADQGDADGGRDIEIGFDSSVPNKAEGNYNNGWVSRDQLLAQTAKQKWELPKTAPGKAKVCGWGLSVSDNPAEDGLISITVTSPTNEWPFPATLEEGVHFAHIRAINCAGTPAAETDHKEVKVDLTDPAGSFAGVEDGKWYRDGQVVTLAGEDELSGMDAAGPGETDSTRGAYFRYTINGDGPADIDAPRGPQADLVVSGEGAKVLRFSAVDFAGNVASPKTVSFGIDATDPEGYLEHQDAAKPTLVRTALTDPVSGLDFAVTQVRNLAGGAWQTLPTAISGFNGGEVLGASKSGVALARFPDTALPKGNYEVRTFAYDQAGNELVTDRDRDGNKLTLENPMRRATGLSAAIFRGNHKKPVCVKRKKTKKGKKCVRRVKGRVVLVGGKSETTVGWNRAGVIQGYLTTANYAPIKNQTIEIYTKSDGRAEVLEGTTSTRADGYYYFRLRPGVSRKVRVVFQGTELLEDRSGKLTFNTKAKVSLKVSRKHVRSGGKVTFTGKVTTRDRIYPARGKLVVLQFYSNKKWRPAITIARTKADGRFRVSYRFSRASSKIRARIKFRVIAPTEIDFHHATSASPAKIVRVN
jgi:hypothetical protein